MSVIPLPLEQLNIETLVCEFMQQNGFTPNLWFIVNTRFESLICLEHPVDTLFGYQISIGSVSDFSDLNRLHKRWIATITDNQRISNDLSQFQFALKLACKSALDADKWRRLAYTAAVHGGSFIYLFKFYRLKSLEEKDVNYYSIDDERIRNLSTRLQYSYGG